ncbi:MAG TPA: carboxypeptidase regulatory-like domain-containing protein [Gemmatimonadaceae bacterium]|nr:carboxypeptidase regulatory-like domain-containing protein [Gemmatimonadaceae bacterium]
MRTDFRFSALVLAACLHFGNPSTGFAQGVTTAAIHGIVRDENGSGIDGASIRVVNLSTGYITETRARAGIFVVHGLATGGFYRVLVTKLGYAPEFVDKLTLTLGEDVKLRLTLVSLVNHLDTVRISASNQRSTLRTGGGVATLFSDSSLRQLPALNRDLYDFARLVPQVSSRFGLSAAGTNFRFNNYMIDGVSDRQLQGNNVLGGATGGKTISIEAIQEYQVLLSPYAARYGDFTGMLVNAVTKNGTNEFHGSGYGYARNAGLARTNSFAGNSPYRREQFGFSLGGPIIRNRLHFFIAPEFQHATAPTPGPYVGQSSSASTALLVSADSIARFVSLLGAKGVDAGDGGRVLSANPAMTMFGRVDLALPEWRSRVVLLENYSAVEVTRFSRPEGIRIFPLSSNAWTLRTAKKSTSLQVFTQPWSSAFNELLVAYMDRPVAGTGYAGSPSIQVSVAGANGGTPVTLIAGPPARAGGAAAAQILAEIADHFVLNLGSRHTLGAGVRVESFQHHAQGVPGSFGQWAFPSLDALANGDASLYAITRDFGGARARVRGVQPSAYVSDEWLVGERFSLTLGLRADALSFSGAPKYNPAVDSIFHRRTSDYPRTQLQWSPRLGFEWTPSKNHLTHVSGGAGIFVAPPPLGWLLTPVRANGADVRTLECTASVGPLQVPKFVADRSRQPLECADGQGFPDGPVDFVDPNLRMAESFRTSLTIDRRLPWNVDATIDALYSRVRSDFLFVNAGLAGPQGVDAHGRVLYGTISSLGRAQPALVTNRKFSEAIDLRNHSLGHSWSLTAQVNKSFSDRAELRASYTHSRSRDVQSLTNASAIAPYDIWAGGRQISSSDDELTTGVSAFEVAHRIVFTAGYVAPWRRWKTAFSLYYIGESGYPITFGDSSSNRMGDLNADGTSANDPIYVPRDARDPAEITFAGKDSIAQGAAFEQFIQNTACLARQRGTIMARNSCRAPWVHTTNASLRQSLPAIGGRTLSLQIEVFNVLNLLNSSWGLVRVPNPWILEHVGQTKGSSPQPVFHFNPAAVESTQNLESAYQLQLSVRYSF